MTPKMTPQGPSNETQTDPQPQNTEKVMMIVAPSFDCIPQDIRRQSADSLANLSEQPRKQIGDCGPLYSNAL